MTIPTSLLDEVLPEYDISATYSIHVRAEPQCIYAVLQKGLPQGMLTRILMAIRRFPGRIQNTTPPSSDAFYRLKEATNRELVLGIIGQFWKPGVRLIPIHSLEDFLAFHRDGFCKAALNLTIEEKAPRQSILKTETRVMAYGKAKAPMKRYWRVIGPFSGLIRKEVLRKIKRQAENPEP
jgi:hypothetical protein